MEKSKAKEKTLFFKPQKRNENKGTVNNLKNAFLKARNMFAKTFKKLKGNITDLGK